MICPPVRMSWQLTGSNQQSANCGPCSTVMLVRFASCGRLSPSPTEIRRRMGDFSGPTEMSDIERAVLSFDSEAREVGLKPLYIKMMWNEPWGDLIAALKNDRMVCVLVDYGTINQIAPRRSGDKQFTGDHFFDVKGWRQVWRKGRQYTEVQVYDPLADGRRPNIPTGPGWWPVEIVREAAEDAATSGRASFLIVPRAPELEVKDPAANSGQGVKS